VALNITDLLAESKALRKSLETSINTEEMFNPIET